MGFSYLLEKDGWMWFREGDEELSRGGRDNRLMMISKRLLDNWSLWNTAVINYDILSHIDLFFLPCRQEMGL
jgi:hypothetical protein